MIYNFSDRRLSDRRISDRKNQNDLLEGELRLLKKEYEKPQMTAEQLENLKRKMREADMELVNRRRKTKMLKITAAAALTAGFIALPNTSADAARVMGKIPVIGQLAAAVTFRNYTYESERNTADIRIPEINAADKKLERSAEEINAEIKEITDRLVKEFKEGLKQEDGYQDVRVDSEVLASADDYFTLKLNCYQASGSGYEWNYYYTIDLKTGERMRLKDLFQDGADYLALISDSIKEQMAAQMAEDENVIYWLDSDMEEGNFESITDDTSFYLNEKGNLVIGFNEGDVAPMYMGAVEFEIPADVLEGIRK